MNELSEALALVEAARAIGALVENPTPEQVELQKRMRGRALELLLAWKAPEPAVAKVESEWRGRWRRR